MKKNDIFELEITDMGTDGEGIGHYDGMTFFVQDALIGDVITARATKLKKNYGYARVEEIKTCLLYTSIVCGEMLCKGAYNEKSDDTVNQVAD